MQALCDMRHKYFDVAWIKDLFDKVDTRYVMDITKYTFHVLYLHLPLYSPKSWFYKQYYH